MAFLVSENEVIYSPVLCSHPGHCYTTKKQLRCGSCFLKNKLKGILGFDSLLAGLPDHAVYSFGRLGAALDPLLYLFEVERVVFSFNERGIRTYLFDIATITTGAAINNNDFVVRAILGALTIETNGYCHNDDFRELLENLRS